MSIIKSIYSKMVIGNIKETDDEPDVEEWLLFLKNLPEVRDCIDESYNKYLCRTFHFQFYKRILLNIFSFPMTLLSYVSLLHARKRLPVCKGSRLLIERKADLDYSDIMPQELPGEYDQVMEVLDARAKKEIIRIELTRECSSIYKKVIKKHPLSFYFQFWTARELSKHCRYICKYNPSATVVYVEERNIAGPVLRHLYESTGRKYISFMHGEYLLRLIQGYMAFSEYYIWAPEYADIFSGTLRCNIKKYILYRPGKLEKKWNLEDITPEYFCTYYFSAESKRSIKKLSEIYAQLTKKGYNCKVRPHPRYSQWDIIKEYFPAEQIEDPANVTIEQSLAKTQYVIGLATTVLAEGFYEGKEIVIDDVTSPEKYENLEKRNFIMLKRPHMLLSDLIRREVG